MNNPDLPPVELIVEPDSAALIETALEAGEIDAQEALKLHVLAQFRDSTLPPQFIGSGPGHHLVGLADATKQLSQLRPEVRDTIEPYLRRPNDPDSAFMQPAGDPTSVPPSNRPPASKRLLAQIPTQQVVQEDAETKDEEPDLRATCSTWESLRLTPLPFTIWACADGGAIAPKTSYPEGETSCLATDSANDGSPARPTEPPTFALYEVGGPLDCKIRQVLGQMIQDRPAGLGPAIPDEINYYNTDPDIDIYVLNHGWLVPPRDDLKNSLPAESFGVAISATPVEGTTSSGYALVDRHIIKDELTFLSTIVHEVFHIQQYARSTPTWGNHWLLESTATWAEWFYLPQFSRALHEERFAPLQSSPQSLADTKPTYHMYDSYYWFLYMQQEAALGADSIFAIWDEITGVAEDDGLAEKVMSVIDSHTPFATAFPDFAMRLLNPVRPGDPVPTRFIHLDPKAFDGLEPNYAKLLRSHRLDQDPVTIDYSTWRGPTEKKVPPVGHGVPRLGYRYDQVEISDTSADFGVRIRPDDFLQLDSDSARLEALVRGQNGNYRRHVIDLAPGAEPIQFCNPKEIILVLTNISTRPNNRVFGTATVERSDAPECSLAGNLTWNFTGSWTSEARQVPVPTRVSMTVQGTLNIVTGPLESRDKSRRPLMPKNTPEEFLPPPDLEYFYPDAGSTWSMTGTYLLESCERWAHTTCINGIEEVLIAENQPLKDFRILMVDGVPTLEGSLPLQVTMKEYAIIPDKFWIYDLSESWALACPSKSNWFASFGPRTPGGLTPIGSSDPLVGSWTDGSKTTIEVQCNQHWSHLKPAGPGGQEQGSSALSINGTFTVQAN